jgi:UPF0755 protein
MIKLPRFGIYTLFIAIFMIIGVVSFKVWQIINQINYLPIAYSEKIYLPPHSSAKTLARLLTEKKFLEHPRVFLFLIKQSGYANRLKSGTYLIGQNDSVWRLVEKMVRGDVYRVPFKIIEGTRLCELIAAMQQSSEYVFNEDIIHSLPKQHASLEGLLFPSTYLQPYGESILPVLKLAYQTMDMKLNEVWMNRDMDLPYHSSYELLIAASIIEKETAIEEERKLISGVIINRLRLGMPLQMDPTVAYALPGCEHVVLKGSDLKVDSEYNSYLHRGLPPTPISMVSLSSLGAAAHPTRTTFLYFVAKGDGHHVFSNEYKQQKNAINQYLRTPHVE